MVGALAFPGGNDGTSATVSGIMGFCGGSTLAMIGSTVLPEAFEQAASLLLFHIFMIIIYRINYELVLRAGRRHRRVPRYLYYIFILFFMYIIRAATSSASRASSGSSQRCASRASRSRLRRRSEGAAGTSAAAEYYNI